eukprot:1256364-Lingulodinium_polyedra.AAC.1
MLCAATLPLLLPLPRPQLALLPSSQLHAQTPPRKYTAAEQLCPVTPRRNPWLPGVPGGVPG